MAWISLESDPPLLWSYYGRGDEARCTVVGDGFGGLIVYSPGTVLTDEMAHEIEALGEVRWLLAPNHFHYMGLTKWKRRYPEARIVAGQGARPRLGRKCESIGAVGAISEMKLGSGLRVLEVTGARQGEVWLSAQGADHRYWIVGDVFTNATTVPSGWRSLVWRLVGRGFRVNRVFWTLFANDKNGLKRWLREALAEAPPSVLVPCHGEIVCGEPVPVLEQIEAVLREL